MRIKLVGSAIGDELQHQFATSFVIDDTLAIDAGCIGFLTPLAAQQKIQHIFLTHSHIDHVGSLPSFLDGVYEPSNYCPTIYASQPVLDCLRGDVFNNMLWPDLIQLSSAETPFLKMIAIESGQPVILGDAKITPVAVNHVVPTFAYLIEKEGSAVAIVTDTGPTEQIWELANTITNLKAVFLETSFPNSMQWLAEKAKHLTPTMFRDEIAKLNNSVPVLAMHLKPAFREQIIGELRSLAMPQVEIALVGHDYIY